MPFQVHLHGLPDSGAGLLINSNWPVDKGRKDVKGGTAKAASILVIEVSLGPLSKRKHMQQRRSGRRFGRCTAQPVGRTRPSGREVWMLLGGILDTGCILVGWESGL